MAAQALQGKATAQVPAEYLPMKVEEAAVVLQHLKFLHQEAVHHEAAHQEDRAMEVELLPKNHLQNVLPVEVAPTAGQSHADQVYRYKLKEKEHILFRTCSSMACELPLFINIFMGKDHMGHPAGSGRLKNQSIRLSTPAGNLEEVDEIPNIRKKKDELPNSIREKYFEEKRNKEDSTDADDRQ